MAGGEGIRGFEGGEFKGYEGKLESEPGIRGIEQDIVTPGAERRGETEGRDVPLGVRDAARQYDSSYETNGPKTDLPTEPANKGFGFFEEPTRVNSLEARRASAEDVVFAPIEFVRSLLGDPIEVQRGQAEFVPISSVKARTDAIENETSWSENNNKAVSRKAAQLEPALIQKHTEAFLKEGLSKPDAEKRAKAVAKEEAKEQATNWYKDATLRRRQWVDARAAEHLPEMQRKYRRNPDMAKHQAERKAKAEWDKRIQDAKDDLPVVVDTSIPGMGYDYLRTVDHHGAFLKKADGGAQKANATMQMMNHFESALRAAGAKDINHPTDAQVSEAMRILNLKQVTTDNLADGGWSVWMAKHQAEVMKDPDLRATIRKATYFEDFTAFSQGRYDRKDPAVELQASLFFEYGKILAKYKVEGSDRIPPDKAEAIMTETMAAMDKMIYDPAVRAETAGKFWDNVDAARAKAEKAVIYEGKTPDGRTVMKFYDMKQLGDFTIFEQWLAVPDIYRQRPGVSEGEGLNVQVTVTPLPNGNTLPIVAVPFGNKVGGKGGMLSVLDALNKAEKAKADELGVPSNFWFGKDSVVLPNPAGGGSRLSMEEIAAIVTNPKYGLFDTKGVDASHPVDGKGDKLETVDGNRIGPLNPHYVADVRGFAAQRAYKEASKVIDTYGVSTKGAPRAKGERIEDLAYLGRDANGVGGDPRAKEALDLLFQIKSGGELLIAMSEQKAVSQEYVDVQAKQLSDATARFKTLVAELGIDAQSAVAPEKRPELKDKAQASVADFDTHRQFTDSTGHTDGTMVEYLRDADAWAVQGNAVQKGAARDVLAAAESNKTVLKDIAVLEKTLSDPNGFADAGERARAEKAVGELYGLLERNMKVIDRWKNYMAERKDFDFQVATFEVPYIASALNGAMRFLGFDAPSPLGVVDVTTRSPEYYEDLGAGVGKQPGDYAVTVWVKSTADQSRILGDIASKQNPNRMKWSRDGQGRFVTIIDGKGRQMEVHVAVVPEKVAIPQTAPVAAPVPQPYDMAARRASNGSSTDHTVPGK